MIRTTLAAALFAATLAPAAAETAPLPSPQDIEQQFSRWEAALATQDPAQVAALFAPDGILEPTVSNEIRTTPARVEAYFVDFLKLAPKASIKERHIRVLDGTTAIDAGIWSFDVIRDGTPETLTGRYTLVWERKDETWKIQLLHSSLMPEPVAN